MKEINKEKEEDERKIERIYGKVKQMEREQKKCGTRIKKGRGKRKI